MNKQTTFLHILAKAQASSLPKKPPPIIAITLDFLRMSCNSSKSLIFRYTLILSLTSSDAPLNTSKFFGAAPESKNYKKPN